MPLFEYFALPIHQKIRMKSRKALLAAISALRRFRRCHGRDQSYQRAHQDIHRIWMAVCTAPRLGRNDTALEVRIMYIM